jgi:N-acetylglucosaminyldiphosphoundecaprenol N-acetyl-beta-D-mannosaminyltransferase
MVKYWHSGKYLLIKNLMPELYILGVKINDISLNEATQKIADFLLTGNKGYITTPNPEICLQGYNNKAYRRILNNSFIAIPDGIGLKVGAKILGAKLNNNTTGVDLCAEVIKLAEQKMYSVLILGGIQEAGEKTIFLYSYKYPKLKLQYLNGGNFNEQGISDQTDLIQQVNVINPDIIFTCLGAPKQEYFIANNLEKLNAKLMLGVGGSIDFLGQQLKRAPQSWRKIGLEWLWRLIQEPWRWKRILNAVIIFPLACLAWKFGNLFIYRKNVAAFIINDKKQIFLGKHTNSGDWKLPQGGAKKASSQKELEIAIMREMRAELGTSTFSILKMLKNCYKYTWPESSKNIDRYKGQKQTLFLLEFNGADKDIKLDRHEHTDWQWANKDKILNIAAPCRQKLIQIGLEKFKDYL